MEEKAKCLKISVRQPPIEMVVICTQRVFVPIGKLP